MGIPKPAAWSMGSLLSNYGAQWRGTALPAPAIERVLEGEPGVYEGPYESMISGIVVDVQQVVACQEAGRAGGEVWPARGGWPLARDRVADPVERAHQAFATARDQPAARAAEELEHPVGPRRAHDPQGGQEHVVERELPREDLADRFGHVLAPRSWAIDLSR